MTETRWHPPLKATDKILCARCKEEKGMTAFVQYQKVRLPGSGQTIAVERDIMCRQCRNEAGRGVPDQIVALRTKEQRLARELAKIRKEIKDMRRGELESNPYPESDVA